MVTIRIRESFLFLSFKYDNQHTNIQYDWHNSNDHGITPDSLYWSPNCNPIVDCQIFEMKWNYRIDRIRRDKRAPQNKEMNRTMDYCSIFKIPNTLSHVYIYINSCIQYSVCHVLKFMRACVRSFVRYFHQYSVLLLPKHTLPQPDQSNRHFFYSHSNADQKNWLVWI